MTRWAAAVQAVRADLATATALAAIDERLAAAQRVWPTLSLEPEQFVVYLAERLRRDVPAETALAALHGDDLYLACACAQRLPAALATLERDYLAPASDAVARIDRSSDFVAEVHQRVLERLFVGSRPRILDYAGSGPLAGWLRIVATRVALNARREQRRAAHERQTTGTHPEPAVDLLQRQYRSEVDRAFRTGFALLNAESRQLLWQHYGERISLEALGRQLGVDRSTASRRVAAARRTLLEATRQALSELVPAMTTTSRDDLLLALRSHLDFNLASVLKP